MTIIALKFKKQQRRYSGKSYEEILKNIKSLNELTLSKRFKTLL